MVEQLKRQYDVIVLKVELLDVIRDAPDLRFTLQCKFDDRLEDVRSWTTHAGNLGLRNIFDARNIAPGSEPDIRLPTDLLNDLVTWFKDQARGNRTLWIHLVKPYGPLYLVPWERLLGTMLNVPVLMLPDFIFPRPREAPTTLEVALCGSAPLGHDEYSIRNAVLVAAQRILEGSPRRTRLHVFVDAQLADSLRNEWSSAGKLGSQVLVYDNNVAQKYAEDDPSTRLADRAGELRSPWLLWMREALQEHAVDVLHFCCHGFLSRGRGALLFAQSPVDRSDRYLAGPVGAVELQTFLTQIGAWSSVFTSVPDNFSEPGLRTLADHIAQTRPGPLMLHSLRIDPSAADLAAGYHFLYSNIPEMPPQSAALFMYCQPYLSADTTSATPRIPSSMVTRDLGPPFALPPIRHDGFDPPLRPLPSPPVPTWDPLEMKDLLAHNASQMAHVTLSTLASPLDPLFWQGENIATWVAATERFAEQVQLKYQEMARDELLPGEMAERQTRLVMKTMDSLREAVIEQLFGTKIQARVAMETIDGVREGLFEQLGGTKNKGDLV